MQNNNNSKKSKRGSKSTERTTAIGNGINLLSQATRSTPFPGARLQRHHKPAQPSNNRVAPATTGQASYISEKTASACPSSASVRPCASMLCCAGFVNRFCHRHIYGACCRCRLQSCGCTLAAWPARTKLERFSFLESIAHFIYSLYQMSVQKDPRAEPARGALPPRAEAVQPARPAVDPRATPPSAAADARAKSVYTAFQKTVATALALDEQGAVDLLCRCVRAPRRSQPAQANTRRPCRVTSTL